MNMEGSKGLTILEVADRIQKSDLRDLSTSKTPEASIVVALSRDANLFERVTPSGSRTWQSQSPEDKTLQIPGTQRVSDLSFKRDDVCNKKGETAREPFTGWVCNVFFYQI
jgi:hypothetical protein